MKRIILADRVVRAEKRAQIASASAAGSTDAPTVSDPNAPESEKDHTVATECHSGVCVCVCVRACVCMCVCVCVYIYIYISIIEWPCKRAFSYILIFLYLQRPQARH